MDKITLGGRAFSTAKGSALATRCFASIEYVALLRLDALRRAPLVIDLITVITVQNTMIHLFPELDVSNGTLTASGSRHSFLNWPFLSIKKKDGFAPQTGTKAEVLYEGGGSSRSSVLIKVSTNCFVFYANISTKYSKIG